MIYYRFVESKTKLGIFRYLHYIDCSIYDTDDEELYQEYDNIQMYILDHLNKTKDIFKSHKIFYNIIRYHYFKSTARHLLYQMYKLKRLLKKFNISVDIISISDDNNIILYEDHHQIVIC